MGKPKRGRTTAPGGLTGEQLLARVRRHRCMVCNAPLGERTGLWCAVCVAGSLMLAFRAGYERLWGRQVVGHWIDRRVSWPTRDEYLDWLDELERKWTEEEAA